MSTLRQAVSRIVRLQEAADLQHLAATTPSRIAARRLEAGDPQLEADAQVIRSRTAVIRALRGRVIELSDWEQNFVMDLTIMANTTDESGRLGGGLVTLSATRVQDLAQMARVYLPPKQWSEPKPEGRAEAEQEMQS